MCLSFNGNLVTMQIFIQRLGVGPESLHLSQAPGDNGDAGP